jgi:hypothetical protein
MARSVFRDPETDESPRSGFRSTYPYPLILTLAESCGVKTPEICASLQSQETKETPMTLKRKLLLAALAASLLAAPAEGRAEPPSPLEKSSKTASRRKPAKPVASKPVAEKPAQAPDCPRAQYKGDPVCFGAEDAAALPLPSSGSAGTPKHSEDVTLSAKTRVNQPVESPTYFNNPNPHPSGNDFGGGVGVGFHF